MAVSANTIGLSKGLGSAGSIVTGFGSKLGGLLKIAGPIGVALGGITAAVKGITEVGQAFGDVDRIAKAADSYGITTEEMVGLEHAANLSGVSTEALGKAMQRATRQGMNLPDIADQLAAMEDPAERAAFAYKTLGRQGQDLVPLLAAGGDAIRDMMAEGNDLAGFSRLDAKKVEEANDAISRMKLAFTGVARDIAISLAPTVEKVAVGVRMLGQWTRDAFTRITPIISQVGNVIISVWDTVWSATTSVFGGIFGNAQTTFADVADFILDSLIVAEFAFTNIGDVAGLAWEQIKLGAIGLWEDFNHLFTAQIPAVLNWFGENWQDIFFTAFDLAATGFINLGQNIRNAMSAIWDYITGGSESLEFAWTPLTEGFFNAIDSMPEIPERMLTDLEQQIGRTVDSMGEDLSGRLAEHMEKRRSELLGGGESFQIADTFSIDDLPDEVETASGNAPEAFDFGLSAEAKQALKLQAQGAGGETPEQKTARELAAHNAQNKAPADAALAIARQQLAALIAIPRPATII